MTGFRAWVDGFGWRVSRGLRLEGLRVKISSPNPIK